VGCKLLFYQFMLRTNRWLLIAGAIVGLLVWNTTMISSSTQRGRDADFAIHPHGYADRGYRPVGVDFLALADINGSRSGCGIRGVQTAHAQSTELVLYLQPPVQYPVDQAG
jgi:hypothetical protein